MDRQIYYSLENKIEAILTNQQSSTVNSNIHPISKFQILSIPETKLVRGSKESEKELMDEILSLINPKRKNPEKIALEIINNTKAYLYSALP